MATSCRLEALAFQALAPNNAQNAVDFPSPPAFDIGNMARFNVTFGNPGVDTIRTRRAGKYVLTAAARILSAGYDVNGNLQVAAQEIFRYGLILFDARTGSLNFPQFSEMYCNINTAGPALAVVTTVNYKAYDQVTMRLAQSTPYYIRTNQNPYPHLALTEIIT
jgi:hypothetical protein